MITVVVIGRIDVSRIHVQVVCVSRRFRSTRPSVAVVADVVDNAIGRVDIPATDKSQK